MDAYLRAGAPLDSTDALGLTPLNWALIRGHDAIALRLLTAGASRDNSTLVYAVAYGRLTVLQAMWSNDVREEARGSAGELAEAAVFMNQPETLLWLEARTKTRLDERTMLRLLTIALHQRNHSMAEIVLHRLQYKIPPADIFSAAVEAGDLIYLDQALRKGADPDGDIGLTEEPALYFVASSLAADTAPAVAQRLIRAGASVSAKHAGETALEVLMRHGFDPPSIDRGWFEPAYQQITLEGRRDVARVLRNAGR